MLRNIRIELSRKELESNTHNRIPIERSKGVADEVTPYFFICSIDIFYCYYIILV